jgi:hypothetical protein
MTCRLPLGKTDNSAKDLIFYRKLPAVNYENREDRMSWKDKTLHVPELGQHNNFGS